MQGDPASQKYEKEVGGRTYPLIDFYSNLIRPAQAGDAKMFKAAIVKCKFTDEFYKTRWLCQIIRKWS